MVAQLLEQSAHDIINGVSSEEVADDRQERKRVRRMLWHRRTLWPVGWSKMDGPTDIFSSGIEKLVRYSSIEPCDRCPETECAPLSLVTASSSLRRFTRFLPLLLDTQSRPTCSRASKHSSATCTSRDDQNTQIKPVAKTLFPIQPTLEGS